MSTLAIPIRLPDDVLEALGAHSGIFWSDSRAMEPIICDAIRAWINHASAAPAPWAPPAASTASVTSIASAALAAPAAPAAQQQPGPSCESGYQWKEVFLPEGTRLRASFGNKPCFAVVEGAEIRYGGRAISPSRFANQDGSGNRNAWKSVWLRLPGDDDWLLADVRRSARKAALARMLADKVHGGATSAAGKQAPRDEALFRESLKSFLSLLL